MYPLFVLFAIAWGISPFFLIWLITKYRDKANMLPEARRNIQAKESENADLAEKLDVNTKKNVEQEKSIESLGKRLLKDNVKFTGSKITGNNYSTSKKNYEKVFTFCEKSGYSVSPETKKEIMGDLKASFEEAVRKQWQKEEQARIKLQIREEQKLEAERQRELQRLENTELAIETALQKALQKTQDEHGAEVERLRAQLKEAQEKLQKAKSMAELTRAGYVYVISNIGSFGENVFKIGMTRRLEPLDRVRELGDASVPFHYDVHMMISSDDAPSLENALHKELHKVKVNKVNPRREFFKVDIDTIAKLVQKQLGSSVDYVATPEALEYNESLNMTDEDFDFVSEQMARFEQDEEGYLPKAQTEPLSQEKESVAEAASENTGVSSVPVSTGTETINQPIHEQKTSKQPQNNRRAAACPHCKGSIYIDTLVNGKNTCPHCEHTFSVKGK